MRRFGKKAQVWKEERDQWFIDNPPDDNGFYWCHYCEQPMDQQNCTIDHSNNRNHAGILVPCCWFDNGRKGSMSHDRYVEQYYPDHKCKEQ